MAGPTLGRPGRPDSAHHLHALRRGRRRRSSRRPARRIPASAGMNAAEPEHEQQHSHRPARGGRPGSSFSPAMNAAISAIQPRLMTPTANSAAISAQQHPRHQAPCLRPRSRAPLTVAPALGEEHHRAAALDEARPLQRRHLVDRRGHDHSSGHISPPRPRPETAGRSRERARTGMAARPAAVQTMRYPVTKSAVASAAAPSRAR